MPPLTLALRADDSLIAPTRNISIARRMSEPALRVEERPNASTGIGAAPTRPRPSIVNTRQLLTSRAHTRLAGGRFKIRVLALQPLEHGGGVQLQNKGTRGRQIACER